MCHDEVILYVKWHNNAFEWSKRLGVPTLVLHYADYEDAKFNKTVSTLLDFLEMKQKGQAKPFHTLEATVASNICMELYHLLIFEFR